MAKKKVARQDMLLEQLKAIDAKLDKVRTEDIPDLKVEVSALKVKASLWGGVSGIVGGFLAFLIPTR